MSGFHAPQFVYIATQANHCTSAASALIWLWLESADGLTGVQTIAHVR